MTDLLSSTNFWVIAVIAFFLVEALVTFVLVKLSTRLPRLTVSATGGASRLPGAPLPMLSRLP
ncbi:MAG TPA: hypothetical protein VL742_13130 [Casimicrobiaceae bacterium]|nr:hypothetical protein [Casimicrobiaceae bacterium]